FGHKLASSQGADLSARARDVAGVQVVAHRMDGVDRKALLETLDALKSRLDKAVVYWRRSRTAKLHWWPVAHNREAPRYRPAGWLTSWPARSAARAAAVPTWRRREAMIRRRWIAR